MAVQLATTQSFLQNQTDCFAGITVNNFLHKVAYVYNPLEYAAVPHAQYVNNYLRPQQTVLFLGMNPGPFGMAQNGIPFGNTAHVRDFLNISGDVQSPPSQHHNHIVQGLNFTRTEVSGRRLWEFVQNICGTPEQFFTHCYVDNYCPLLLLDMNGKNIPLDKLRVHDRSKLEALCDQNLLNLIQFMRPQTIIAIGKYVYDRLVNFVQQYTAVDPSIAGIQIVRVPHPSTANRKIVKSDEHWNMLWSQQLEGAGVMGYLRPS